MAEAEKHAEEDKILAATVGARNGLEQYCYNLRNTLADESKGLRDKMSEEVSQVRQHNTLAIWLVGWRNFAAAGSFVGLACSNRGGWVWRCSSVLPGVHHRGQGCGGGAGVARQ